MRLREGAGLARCGAQRISQAGPNQKVCAKIMVFCTSMVVGTPRAVPHFKTMGDACKVMAEPYAGARTRRHRSHADAIAASLGN